MNDEDLKIKLTRKMKSEDFCHQRIFSCIPLLWLIYGDYMSKSKSHDFSYVFLNVIKDWNNERNKEINKKFGSSKYILAINELKEFYSIICQLYESCNNDYLDISFQERLSNLSLDNYKDISNLCNIYIKSDNRSKIICRISTFKKKSQKILNGVIPLEKFIKYEVIPQKEFFDLLMQRLSLFEPEQLCIFMLCYDIRKSNQTIFTKHSNNVINNLF